MSELDKEKDQFLLQVRDDFIDIITRQVEFEEKARQYRLIFQLAEKYRQADPKSISEFIDSEKKNAEKEKNSVRTNVTNLKQANESINSRKSFIPMLELEYCILTTTDIPESLNMNLSFKNNRNAIDFDFNSKDTDKRENIKKLFETPFDNIVAEIFISEQKQKITHAQVIITSLAFLPENWPIFLAEFKNNYKEVEKNRYSLLYFLTTWFEMRPKHFLKMFPHLIDLIEECDDSDLLIKHLKIIFDFSKRNMHFSFLPLDSIPSTFRLNYIQTSDYHKLISGSDATTMQNSFKSNMLKRFDLTNKKFCGESDGEEEKNPAPKAKKKKNNTPIPITAPTPAPAATANNSNNDNDNQNKNQTKNDYPQQPNLQDFADAIIILITTIQNALSLDCFIPEKTEDMNISESNDVYKNFHEINYQSTKHLKYLFTESEFDYWKEKINTIEVAKKGIQKLKAILEGFSNWFVEVLNSQKLEKNPVFNTINNNFTKLFNKVKEIDENIAKNFLKVDLNEVDQEVKNKIPKDIYQDFEKIDKPAKDWPQIPDCFFSDEQRSYKSQENHNITLGDKNHNKYSDLQNLTQNIMYILGIRPKIKSIHMEKYDYEIIQKNFNSENHNDKAQQYIDPWAIRTIFYNFTRFIFSDKYKNFKFQI